MQIHRNSQPGRSGLRVDGCDIEHTANPCREKYGRYLESFYLVQHLAPKRTCFSLGLHRPHRQPTGFPKPFGCMVCPWQMSRTDIVSIQVS